MEETKAELSGLAGEFEIDEKRALGVKMVREGWSEDVFTEGR